MNVLREFNRSMLIVVLACFFSGIFIIFKGMIWDLILGDERYIVGGTMIIAGLYFLILIIQDAKNKK